MTSEWFATCPKGLEGLLAAELQALGAEDARETIAGVHFNGPQAIGYRACLWSRLANRVLRPLAGFDVEDADQLYTQLRTFDWSRVCSARNSIAIDFSGTNRSIRNTQFGAQRCKDAIVDWFKDNGGLRPTVDRRNPDVRINVRLTRGKIAVALDYSGASLHQRGYRQKQGAAPLKENLAAAILLRADWPGAAARGGALIDPMCGSGTLLLEGAMMAADIAPGLGRKRFGFEKLPEHNDTQWRAIVADARGRAERGRQAQLPEIRGYDADPKVIRRAEENVAQLGMEKVVRVAVKPLAELKKPTHTPLPYGLLVCNPPYGERLGEKKSLTYLYSQLGQVMTTEFADWDAAIFTSDLELGRAIGLRSHKRYALYNGALEAHLLLFTLKNNNYRETAPAPVSDAPAPAAAAAPELSEGAAMFSNRIRKNKRRLKNWLKREQVQCYRLYDADMPEYAVAVDIYGDHAHVAEYQAPKGIDPQSADKRLAEVTQALPDALDMPADKIVFKQRQRQRGTSQYEKQGEAGEFLTVQEGQARLLVNLRDYLDTGLFLDHRPLRLRIAAEARDKDFLNLYCYTGTATVHAALGGASSTTSVDMSKTYLAWLQRNLANNGLGESTHRVEQSDCAVWLAACQRQYDLILLDPPSFSNSKRMEGTFDVQRDHVALVDAAMAVLRPGGTLYFSNNLRGFKLDPALAEKFSCEDISAKTLDPDFQRNQKIHRCWMIRH
ncbi:bifunctional 23S rRNA (guanine(2069)-N(7))-methyltransferase RlmK/23S rRNA (guanine(2445)-N(2))-methyltransferase RlmL [Halioglobus maricola]|uniref:Ribosomal RNA large subunit methyltransferase K/L n=1 Tax=Halioglobus maricola TaxID=2601894 RepID=A0A5P9NK13_9GAMM|nr:bifunctional 23S rRNA (guanine(2069)-N(7))-methyltransferase RlmK/23S rRNA (guanine(2445)-N(2))-methyltransferase RlmL [Halioglobus maricola]QFU76203.1 bifunctional 23S rRNA (guanine(2069)-N(7))-methyltransferase RlmK/23S rRNA (guanine(2445)-N(2))-methyltransferase RlmL [Halioglobus maricola]